MSNEGNFINHPDVKQIGKKFDTYADKIQDGLTFNHICSEKEDQVFHGVDPYMDKQSIFLARKFKIGETDTDWIILTSVPLSAIYADANKAFIKTILIGALGLFCYSVNYIFNRKFYFKTNNKY